MPEKKKDEKISLELPEAIFLDEEKTEKFLKSLRSPEGQKFVEGLKAAKEEAAKAEKDEK